MQGSGHAQVFARSAEVPAHAPAQPVRAGAKALAVPAAGRVERPQVGEQAMHGGVQVDGLLGNVFAQSLNFLDGECRGSADGAIFRGARRWMGNVPRVGAAEERSRQTGDKASALTREVSRAMLVF